MTEFVQNEPEESPSRNISQNRGQFELRKIGRLPIRKPRRKKAPDWNREGVNDEDKSVDKFEEF